MKDIRERVERAYSWNGQTHPISAPDMCRFEMFSEGLY